MENPPGSLKSAQKRLSRSFDGTELNPSDLPPVFETQQESSRNQKVQLLAKKRLKSVRSGVKDVKHRVGSLRKELSGEVSRNRERTVNGEGNRSEVDVGTDKEEVQVVPNVRQRKSHTRSASVDFSDSLDNLQDNPSADGLPPRSVSGKEEVSPNMSEDAADGSLNPPVDHGTPRRTRLKRSLSDISLGDARATSEEVFRRMEDSDDVQVEDEAKHPLSPSKIAQTETLTPSEYETFKEFREGLAQNDQAVPELLDDNTLIRFLRARKFDTALAQDLFLGYCEHWRNYGGTGVEEVIMSFDMVEFREYLNHGIVFLVGEDTLGRPVLWIRQAFYKPKEHDYNRIVHIFVAVLECFAVTSLYQADCVSIVLDMENISWANVDLKLTKAFLILVQNCYPERLGAVFVINQPWITNTLFRMVRPLLDDVTLAKIHMCKSCDDLYEDNGGLLARSLLPAELKGTSKFSERLWNDSLCRIIDQPAWAAEIERRRSGVFNGALDDKGEEPPKAAVRRRKKGSSRRRGRRRGDETNDDLTGNVLPESDAVVAPATAPTGGVVQNAGPVVQPVGKENDGDHPLWMAWSWVLQNRVTTLLVVACLWLVFQVWDLQTRLRTLEHGN